MHIAITGSQGDLGSALSRTNPGHKLRLIDRVDALVIGDSEYRQVDVGDLSELTAALRSCDAVIHLAAFRNPFMAPPEVVYRVNTLGSYNVTLAAESLGIHTVINASSICYYGYLFRNAFVAPPYFPVDEQTPAYPEDSYSLSKLVGEEIMRAFVQRSGSSVVSLRFCYLVPDGAIGASPREGDNTDWSAVPVHTRGWWTYVDVEDAARAVWLSLDYLADKKRHYAAFNISADDSHALVPTRELLAQHYSAVADLRFGTTLDHHPHAGLYSNAKAKGMLGFSPSAPVWREKLKNTGAEQ
jgi:UDP-glucose 4-epimerase